MPVNLESLKASVKILETDRIVKSIQVLMNREKRVGKPTPKPPFYLSKLSTAAAIVQSDPVTRASTNKEQISSFSKPSTQNIPDTLTFDSRGIKIKWEWKCLSYMKNGWTGWSWWDGCNSCLTHLWDRSAPSIVCNVPLTRSCSHHHCLVELHQVFAHLKHNFHFLPLCKLVPPFGFSFKVNFL